MELASLEDDDDALQQRKRGAAELLEENGSEEEEEDGSEEEDDDALQQRKREEVELLEENGSEDEENGSEEEKENGSEEEKENGSEEEEEEEKMASPTSNLRKFLNDTFYISACDRMFLMFITLCCIVCVNSEQKKHEQSSRQEECPKLPTGDINIYHCVILLCACDF